MRLAAIENFMNAKKLLEVELGHQFNQFGELGEIIAEKEYSIKLHDHGNEKTTDGTDDKGQLWQIKCCFTESTKGSNFPVNAVDGMGYLALKIHPDGFIEEVYNGPWEMVQTIIRENKDFSKSAIAFGCCKISNKKLQDLNKLVPVEQKLAKRA